MMMFGTNFSGLDLRCDFPARESFRNDLLSRLLVINELTEEKNQNTGNLEDDPDARELTDSELEMLAAARGETAFPKDWYSED